jgi:hypothetical protein
MTAGLKREGNHWYYDTVQKEVLWLSVMKSEVEIIESAHSEHS